MKRTAVAHAAIVAISIGIGSVANAGQTSLDIAGLTSASTEHRGTFTGTLTWDYTANNTFGKFIVKLTNTSTSAGGKLTGFALSKPVAGLTYALSSETHPFTMFTTRQNVA